MPTTKVSPFTISYTNTEEFHILKSEVFTQDIYYFESDNPEPFIIDAGAHIGLATLYFKKLFPAAKIIAIEPNTQLIPLLEENIFQNGLKDVQILPIALSDHRGMTEFFIDETKNEWWSTGSFEPGAWNHEQHSKTVLVQTEMLGDLISRPVDFLKLDIEGAEMLVLLAAKDKIEQIRHMIIEFHPTNSQNLAGFIEFLQEHRFSTHIWKDGKEILELRKAKGLVYVEAVNRRKF